MSSDYKFLRIDGNTKASDRAAIVKVCFWIELSVFIWNSHIYFSLFIYFSGFPRGLWSSNLSLNFPSWWIGAYTHKSRSCDCGWSSMESKVLVWRKKISLQPLVFHLNFSWEHAFLSLLEVKYLFQTLS